MAPVTIDRALRFWAADRPDQHAIWVSGDGLSYASLDAWVGRVAAMLAQQGLAPGERMAFYAETSIEWCVAAFAAIRCGAIVAPINSRMVQAEVDYLLGNYEPALLFVDADGEERLAGLVPSIVRVGREAIAIEREGTPSAFAVPLDPDLPVAIITTSGSTARPKGVVYSHRAMIEYAHEELVANAPDQGGECTRLLSTSPLSTAGGFNLMVHMVVVGGTIYLLDKFEPEAALACLLEQRVNTFRAAPIFFQRIAALDAFAAADLSHVRVATIGGAQPPPGLLAAWWGHGVVLRQLYGQTEGGGGITVNPIRFAESDPDRCGHGAPFTEIAIIDEHGRRVAPGESGQIIARTPGMMMGYWRNPEATADALIDGWLHTGDLGTVDERGLLKVLDRMKDIIKSGGLNISAAELERVIMEAPGVAEVAIIAAPDPKFGEAPFAILYGDGCTIPGVLEHCRSQLSSYKIPRYAVISDTPLPRLAMGKISKPALRRLYAEAPPPVR